MTCYILGGAALLFWTKFMCTIMKHHTCTETSFFTSFWCKLIIRFACVEKLSKNIILHLHYSLIIATITLILISFLLK